MPAALNNSTPLYSKWFVSFSLRGLEIHVVEIRRQIEILTYAHFLELALLNKTRHAKCYECWRHNSVIWNDLIHKALQNEQAELFRTSQGIKNQF